MHCAVCKGDELEFLFHHHPDWQVWRCTGCGLVQICPLPTQAEINRLYKKDLPHFKPYLEQLSVHRKYFQKKLNEIRKLADRNDSLLDVGCAMGALLVEAKKFGFEPVGLDISHDAVDYCKKLGLRVYQGSLGGKSDLPKNLRFGVVTAFEIIEHERDPLLMLKEIYELLVPGGLVVVTTPGHGSWWRILMGKYWPGFQHPEHLYFFDPKSIQYLFNLVGFKQIEITKDEPREFTLDFVLARVGDYFPILERVVRQIRRIRLIGRILNLSNPFNPWGGIMAVGYKS